MKSRGAIDFYLPSLIAYQIKMILGGLAVTVFFSLIWKGRPFTSDFWLMFIIAFVQLEIFMVIANKIFNHGTYKHDTSYKKQILSRLIRFYLIVMVISAAVVFLTIAFAMYYYESSFSYSLNHFVQYELRGFLISFIIGITIGSVIFFYVEWTQALKRETKLREEKLIFQYETLKSQVNPHFLFNSLNTLSSLVATDAQLSEQFINKLSSIYRYILENRDTDFINLSKELGFVNDYFFLQKIRDNGKIDLMIDVKRPENYEILPISIQLLVENALKHNAATREKPLAIKIYQESENLIVENILQPKMHLEPSSKTGLKNLSERVKLVLNKEVQVESGNGIYKVKIPVKQIK
jgi:two-component system, LytTR family, sensor kinase